MTTIPLIRLTPRRKEAAERWAVVFIVNRHRGVVDPMNDGILLAWNVGVKPNLGEKRLVV